jgi:hypothetical protein
MYMWSSRRGLMGTTLYGTIRGEACENPGSPSMLCAPSCRKRSLQNFLEIRKSMHVGDIRTRREKK